ncbi:hypothetical protein CE91St68_01150 [Methanobrevibacter smithii]|nr:hypothetical protein CE91St67_04090 [Methanobrevibacter smithii]BDF81558.1 hypothetical protein CE91St68_01150 [Methanobrevibacter smithii]
MYVVAKNSSNFATDVRDFVLAFIKILLIFHTLKNIVLSIWQVKYYILKTSKNIIKLLDSFFI